MLPDKQRSYYSKTNRFGKYSIADKKAHDTKLIFNFKKFSFLTGAVVLLWWFYGIIPHIKIVLDRQ